MVTAPSLRSAPLLLLALVAYGSAGCRKDGCVGGDDKRCLPATACPTLRYQCSAGSDTLRVVRLTENVERALGGKAQASVGDFLLENDRVRLVLDAPEHPQGLAPSGGSIIDLVPRELESNGGARDQVNGFHQAAGVLPRDAVRYVSWEVIDQHVAAPGAEAFVAVLFRGHLDGDSRVTVVTRYELRACEPGVRVRSDLYNGSPDPNTLFLTDGLFWGDNAMVPFVPIRGHGFLQPDLDLLKLSRAWRQWPFLAARSQLSPDVSYAIVPCSHPHGAGFNSSTLSAAGIPLRPTLAGDGLRYERFIVAAAGGGVAPAASEAMAVRVQVHGEPPPVRVTGRLLVGGRPVDARGGRVASLLIYEPAPGANPDAESGRLPWTEAVPDSEGRFDVRLPPNRAYRLQPHAFGRPAGPASSIAVATADLDAGDLTIERSARLQVDIEGDGGSRATFAEVVLIPVDRPQGATLEAAPSFYGLFGGCNPMLGPPHGGSPACNRALTATGQLDLAVPPGHYYVYATRGPFATLDRREITLAAGDQLSVSLVSRQIAGLLPTGALSGDFHVHGSGSYDSAIPDQDRVVSFLASGVDVIVASDHDVVTTYDDAVTALGADGQLTIIPGVEATPNILWFAVPGEDFPKTTGHFNFWPLRFDPTAPRNGAPWDELREPGALMDDLEPFFSPSSAAVRQLNHPFAGDKLGRDQGFIRTIGLDPRRPIVPGGGFAADILLHQPGGGRRNIDWDVQEVMTGASRSEWLRYRTFWFSMLSQGFLRAGVANSDTHSLAIERVGYPRNLVFGGHDRAALDLDGFNADVRAGHLVGTNGPVLDVWIDRGDGQLSGPGLEPVGVDGAGTLTIGVASAPWIPVTQVRIIVNGQVVRTTDVSSSFRGLERFGGVPGRTQLNIPLSALLPVAGDAWLVVEAGMPQPEVPDDEDGVADGWPDLPETEVPTRPRTPADPLFDIAAVAPGVWPTAFTNPFILNLDGGDWTPPGLP